MKRKCIATPPPTEVTEDQRISIIIALVKQRATLEKIGKKIGRTTERARQLIKQIVQQKGRKVFKTKNPLRTAREMAKKIGTTAKIINQICANGEVACKRRGDSIKSIWLIRASEIKNLKAHPLIKRQRICVICKKTFVYKYVQENKQTCSQECSKEFSRQRRAAYADQEPTLESIEGWRKDLWQRLQSHCIPKDEKWLKISEASKYTGLSEMQLKWLRHRNIVTIKYDPSRTWRGKPMTIYAASEMEIARKVFEAYTKSNGKHP